MPQSVCENADEIFPIASSNQTFCAGYIKQNKQRAMETVEAGFTNSKEESTISPKLCQLLNYSAYCVTEFYSIFTDVSDFTNWIKNKIDETKSIN